MSGKKIATKKILVINGPNLNMLEKRDKAIYGGGTLKKAETDCKQLSKELNIDVTFKQSNEEGQIVTWIQEAIDEADGIIINAGAHTHTSIAIRDALEMFSKPKVELHISNVHKREKFRHHSFISDVVDGIIIGFGIDGYTIALLGIDNLINNSHE